MKYRKKPVVVEAVQWTGKNEVEVYNFLESQNAKSSREVERTGKNFFIGDFGELSINTLEGNHLARINDYIIKGVQGEFYPCKPDIFAKTYESAE
jgi:hypothetical protein